MKNTILGFASGIVCTLAIVLLSECTPAAAPSPVHILDLAACRKSSEAYRDAGPDAEWAVYSKCSDEADRKDRGGK